MSRPTKASLTKERDAQEAQRMAHDDKVRGDGAISKRLWKHLMGIELPSDGE